MTSINIRNISLSMCLGIFSFHLYVVNTQSVDLKLSRGIAQETPSEALECRKTDVSLADLKDSSHALEDCEAKVEFSHDPSNKTVTLTLYAGLGTYRSIESITIENVVIPHQLEAENADAKAIQAELLTQDRIKAALSKLENDHLQVLIQNVYDAAKTESTPSTTTGPAPEEAATTIVVSSDGEAPAVTPTGDEVTTNDETDEDLSVDDVNAIFKRLDELQENSCMTYYLQNIRPLVVSGSLDSHTIDLDFDEVMENLSVLDRNEKFRELAGTPGSPLAQVLKREGEYASKYAECRKQTTEALKAPCIQEFKALIVKNDGSPQGDSPVKLVGDIIGKTWLSKLTGLSLDQIDLSTASGANNILDGVLNATPGHPEGSGAGTLLDQTIKAIEELNDSIKFAKDGSSARGRKSGIVPVINPDGSTKSMMHQVGDAVSSEDLGKVLH